MTRSQQQLATLVIIFVIVGILTIARALMQPQPVPAPGGEGYLFCFWNVENLFDDKLDDYATEPDAEYDRWFAKNPAILAEKLDHLSDALTKLNDGKGPDILVVAEVESIRAAELLRDALDKKLGKDELAYTHLQMREVSSGRHIAPAIISRVPLDASRTQLLDKRRRILEGHVEANGQDLVLIGSHWTSRVSDKEGEGRDKYADEIQGRFRAMVRSNPAVDFLVCGDFNDTPDDDSVKDNLLAGSPALIDLFTGKDPAEFGTHYHRGKWYIFDQIVISPGLRDHEGWTCDPATVRTVRDLTVDEKGRPWPFGGPGYKGKRGYSDHLPVTVRLHVQGK